MLKNKFINRNPAIAVGKISRGKYTCWINEVLATKHAVQLLNVLEKELNIRIPIMILRGRSVSASPRKITNTT